jgi:cysteinyl-tRNA synthetase
MANYWMHNGFLQVEGEKMSKSLGNFVTIRQLREDWQGYSWPGEALRFNMLRSHYRQPIDWTLHGLDEAHKILWGWYEAIEGQEAGDAVPPQIVAALSDDLNTPGAIAELHALERKGELGSLSAALRFLGFSGVRARLDRKAHLKGTAAIGFAGGATLTVSPIDKSSVDRLIDARNAARKTKNFKEADRLRDELTSMGIELEDTKDGTKWKVKR